jgi:hypothetical protein
MTELERCEAEICGHEANRRVGHRDVPGLFCALIDWRAHYLWLVVAEKAKEAKKRYRARYRFGIR